MYVASSKLAIYVSNHLPGNVYDEVIFIKYSKEHNEMFRGKVPEIGKHDDGPYLELYPDFWAVLCDKAYAGLFRLMRAVHLKKKTKHRVVDKYGGTNK